MATPRWTAEWRTDVRALVCRLDATSADVDELLVDHYIRSLHAHSYLDVNPSQVKQRAWGLIETLQFHHRDRHAERLADVLFGSSDAKMGLQISPEITAVLLHLATAPTALTEADLDDIEAIRVGGASRRTMADQARARAKEATRALVEDLKQLTLEDDWFQHSDDDDDESAWSNDDLPSSAPTQPAPIKRLNLPVASSPLHDASSARATSNEVPELTPPEPPVPTPETYGVHKPWLFYQQYRETLHQLKLPALAQTVVSEADLVADAIAALLGVPSTTYSHSWTLPSTCPYIARQGFWADMQLVQFELSAVGRTLAVSHLTPSSLHNLLLRFASAASSLRFLDGLGIHLTRLDGCSTLQGFGHALQQWVRSFRRALVFYQANDTSPTLLATLTAHDASLEELRWLFEWTSTLLTEALGQATPMLPDVTAALLNGIARLLEQYSVLGLPRPYALLLTVFESTLRPYVRALYDYVRGRPLPADVALTSTTTSAFETLLLASIGAAPTTDVAPPDFLTSVVGLLVETHAYARLSSTLHAPPPSLPSLPAPVQSTLGEALLHHTTTASSYLVSLPSTHARTLGKRSSHPPVLPPICFEAILHERIVLPLHRHCLDLGHTFARQFVSEYNLIAHLDTLRWFVLQQQADASIHLTSRLFKHLFSNVHRSRWLEPYTLNLLLQETFLHAPDNYRVDACLDELSLQVVPTTDVSAVPSITWFEQMEFCYAPPSPLHLIFREETIRKYSVLGVFFLQLQGVERYVVQFKHQLRHRVGYFMATQELHVHVLRLAEMLHFVESIHGYAARATSEEHWEAVKAAVTSASRVSEMSDAIDSCLQRMLERCFLGSNQLSIHKYIVSLLHHVVNYVVHFDECLRDLERSSDASATDVLTALAAKFSLGHHYLLLILRTMFKTGSAPHLQHLMLDLNFNDHYAEDDETRA
ncbi:hypothetical protein SPRG_12485 [Saprolegnia parasitica CBS 223.65]|uniref:Spindle pole body component n=1 Tax=Saprolegnia parasitica (strain CBS 223.65) TaxID=695850 RepID=A0A067C4N9_SAPPC|nr:hypothetical protein SPRG_12485 [Saprolegnia parasitica CBS 223.65]KDO21521.1 hypothetical protein SPRG_12485 [Saprolegnia parasitica CBS 223.65]|eukprot:XP_012207788.1 hypothetical protein SPRG_12485 [Saprolegnia parasitica CBS 223.65]